MWSIQNFLGPLAGSIAIAEGREGDLPRPTVCVGTLLGKFKKPHAKSMEHGSEDDSRRWWMIRKVRDEWPDVGQWNRKAKIRILGLSTHKSPHSRTDADCQGIWNLLKNMARPGGLELPTFWFVVESREILSALFGVAYRENHSIFSPSVGQLGQPRIDSLFLENLPSYSSVFTSLISKSTILFALKSNKARKLISSVTFAATSA